MAGNGLPARGRVWQNLEAELTKLRDGDLHWNKGQFFFFWRRSGQASQLAAKEAAALFHNQLFIGELKQQSGQYLSDDISLVVRRLLNAPSGSMCTLTQGGTESNFLGMLVCREKARAENPVSGKPNLVVPNTAHPSLDKAAHYLGLDIIRVPERSDGRADVDALADAINSDTIMLAVSAPSYPNGLVDPVDEVAELARAKKLWLHVDACCSFLLPFMREAGALVPEYDFSIDGVDSIAVDLHKFAYAPPGISSFTLRSAEHHKYHNYEHSAWPAGHFAVDTFAGSRATDVIAGTWTVMQTLGKEGYLEIARGIRKTIEQISRCVDEIPGLELVQPTETVFIRITSQEYDACAVAEGMAERGYPVAWYDFARPTIHLILDPIDDDADFSAWAEALREACEEVRSGSRKRSGAGAVYA